MITALRFADYKSFAGTSELPLRRLSCFIGKNSSGKTAAARAPLLTAESLGHRATTSSPLTLRPRGTYLASNVQELVHGQVPHAAFGIGYSLRTLDRLEHSFDHTFQLVQRLDQIRAVLREFRSSSEVDEVRWIETKGPSARFDYEGVLGMDGLFPVLTADDPRRTSLLELRNAVGDTFDGMVHLTSIRRPLEPVYERRTPGPVVDPSGADAPYLLLEHPSLMEAVADWYTEHFGVRGLSIEAEARAFSFSISGPSGSEVGLARAGQGLQQVLPVVTYLAALRAGLLDGDLVVIEEPELNLHPAVHGAIGDLAVGALTDNPAAQVIFETHSENLLLRLRRWVASGGFAPSHLGIISFEVENGRTSVRPIEVADDGSVSEWPTGVFAEDLAEVRAILKRESP